MNEPKPQHRRPPQISIGFMMLLMVIFALISAGMFYSARVPAVQNDISVLMGGSSGSAEDVGRTAQITFIMFTFTSPLILAGVLSTGVAIRRWYQSRA
jgi:hypothetical protein